MILGFENAEVDLSTVELRRRGVVVPLEPQAFDVLAHLLTNRDRLVTKEELLDAVWGGRFVSEAALSSRIKQIRRALGDDGATQRIVRTVHGRGYRFVAPVHEIDAPVPAGARTDATGSSSPVRYAESDGLNIAYQVTGTGARDIVLVAGFVSHLELDWADPRHAHFLRRLSSFGRLIRFDKRGTGMSDRPGGLPDLETRMHDVLAVMAAAGSRHAVLFGYSEGGPMSVLFAATHPAMVDGLVLYGCYARRLRTPDYPWAPTAEERERYGQQLSSQWSWENDMRTMCPSADDDMARWWGRRARASATPSTIRTLVAMNTQVDVRDVLPAVRVPTLVLHRTEDQDSRVEEGRYIAGAIPGARFVELSGIDHFVAVDPDQILDPVADFLAGLPDSAHQHAEPPALSLAAILAARGPNAAAAAAWLAQAGGEVRNADDRPAHYVVFDGPARAARAVNDYLHQLPGPHPQVSFGMHIGEIARTERTLPGRGAGAAGRLAVLGGDGELWVSAVVRDLLAGSAFELDALGERDLGPDLGTREAFRVRAVTAGAHRGID